MRKNFCLTMTMAVAVAGGSMVLVPAFAQQAAGQTPADVAATRQLVDLTNADRATQGLGALQWNEALAQAAAEHAQIMAQQPVLSHQYPGEPDMVARGAAAGGHFRSMAENVAEGPNPQKLEEEWMHSPLHRANILDPKLNSIGVALVRREGNYYAVVDFSDSIAALGPEQIEQKISQLLGQRGLQPAGMAVDARQTCEMEHGAAGGSRPGFVMRWEGTDLSRLPEALETRIATGKYHKAAVGACDSGNPGQGFTTYKIAVMLF